MSIGQHAQDRQARNLRSGHLEDRLTFERARPRAAGGWIAILPTRNFLSQIHTSLRLSRRQNYPRRQSMSGIIRLRRPDAPYGVSRMVVPAIVRSSPAPAHAIVLAMMMVPSPCNTVRSTMTMMIGTDMDADTADLNADASVRRCGTHQGQYENRGYDLFHRRNPFL